MEMVEFVEKVFDVKLLEYQKHFLKELSEIPKEKRYLVVPRGRRIHADGINALTMAYVAYKKNILATEDDGSVQMIVKRGDPFPTDLVETYIANKDRIFPYRSKGEKI